MSRFRRGARSSTSLLGLVLFAAVGLSFWLALQAYGAARSHRQTTESVLRDYAQVAAAEYARTADGDLSRFFDEAFDEVPRRTRGGLPPVEEVERDLDDAMRALDCQCPAFREPRARARVLLPEGEIEFYDRTVSEAVTSLLVAEVGRRFAADPLERYGFVHLDSPSTEGVTTIAYATVQRETGLLAAVYAVLLDARALAELARYWQTSTELLPSALAKGLPTDSMLSVTVVRADGAPIFTSPVQYEQVFSAADTLSSAHGALVVTAAIRPEAAASLVIGGLPRSRLPVSLALVALTLAVGAVGLLQIRRYEQLSRLREGFVSSVSHELRTPLTQIRMLGELLSEDKLRTQGERTRALHIIRREAQRLTQLVENILQFARIRAAPAGAIELRDVDLAEAVREVVGSFQPLAESAGATVLAESAPGLAVRGQRDGVRRILMNLLDNAIKYGPSGQTVHVHAATENGNVRLVVEDQGPGVPEPDRQRIWDPYWRLPRDVDSVRPGSGMGLAVVRSLTEQYGGSAWVEDAPGVGSRFVVELPRALAAVDAESGSESTTAESA
jgi:signal transduction histidine kinase